MADEVKVDTANNQASAAPAEPTPPVADNPDSRRVRIERVDHDDGPATCVSYDDGSGSLKQWHPDPDKEQFEVAAIIAAAAVKSGYFVEAADTKTKLRVPQQ